LLVRRLTGALQLFLSIEALIFPPHWPVPSGSVTAGLVLAMDEQRLRNELAGLSSRLPWFATTMLPC